MMTERAEATESDLCLPITSRSNVDTPTQKEIHLLFDMLGERGLFKIVSTDTHRLFTDLSGHVGDIESIQDLARVLDGRSGGYLLLHVLERGQGFAFTQYITGNIFPIQSINEGLARCVDYVRRVHAITANPAVAEDLTLAIDPQTPIEILPSGWRIHYSRFCQPITSERDIEVVILKDDSSRNVPDFYISRTIRSVLNNEALKCIVFRLKKALTFMQQDETLPQEDFQLPNGFRILQKIITIPQETVARMVQQETLQEDNILLAVGSDVIVASGELYLSKSNDNSSLVSFSLKSYSPARVRYVTHNVFPSIAGYAQLSEGYN